MSGQTDNLLRNLTALGLNSDEAVIYLLLVRKSTMTALQISREIRMARTKVYRILDNLIRRGLVNIHMDEAGKKFEAASYQQLGSILAKKEAEVSQLKQELPEVFNQLAKLWGRGESQSKVLYYAGVEGLKQITWNSLRAREPLRIFERSSMNEFMDFHYAEKMREEFVRQQIKVRQITNLTHLAAYTQNAAHIRNSEVRHLDPKEMAIEFEVLIYNDVTAIYNFTDEDKFGIEIYNDKLALMQKQLFDFVWSKARKMKILNDQGEAKVIN